MKEGKGLRKERRNRKINESELLHLILIAFTLQFKKRRKPKLKQDKMRRVRKDERGMRERDFTGEEDESFS